jgi:hypothetical protein
MVGIGDGCERHAIFPGTGLQGFECVIGDDRAKSPLAIDGKEARRAPDMASLCMWIGDAIADALDYALEPQETMRGNTTQIRLHQEIDLLLPVLVSDAGAPQHLVRNTPQKIRLNYRQNIKSDRISDCDERIMLLRKRHVKEQFEEWQKT